MNPGAAASLNLNATWLKRMPDRMSQPRPQTWASMNLNAGAGVEPAYPAAAADSPQAAADAIAEDFALLPDWPTRHDYLIELGKRLPPMPPALKTEANLVSGCQSTVFWRLVASRARRRDRVSRRQRCGDRARSDRAAAADLLGQSAESVLAFDLEGFFSRIGLDTNLSLSRRNGLEAMVQRLTALARET